MPILLVASAVLLPAGLAGAFGTFAPSRSYSAGDAPQGVAAGKLNADRKRDLAVSNCAGGDVSVLFGRTKGKFGGPHHHPVGTCPEGVAVADFNRDGLRDIVTVLNGGGDVVILKGKGRKGRFRGPATYPTDLGSPGRFAIGRLNGDRRLDVAVTDDDVNAVSVLLARAHGGFKAPHLYQLGIGANPASIGVGDFNRDGRQDLAVALSGNDEVAILRGKQSGGLGTPHGFPAGNEPGGLAVADLSRDGKLDLAVTNRVDGTVSILKGKADGGFNAPVGYPAGGPNEPLALVAARLNDGRRLDLAVVNINLDRIVILNGKAGGGFGGPQPYGVGDFPLAIAAARFNRDRGTDLAVANANDDDVSVLLNKP